jgi:flavin reductase (DIM6/NTAB) family NADH-FMN oxidoreductase RutF/rubredoxin
MNLKALFEISYGLYLVSARENGKDNGCIINTFSQQTDTPLRVSITINKENLTAEMIDKTGEFTISILSEKATFEMFRRFGMQSGRDVNKFEGLETVRTPNGLLRLSTGLNAYTCCKVISKVDLGTHWFFIAEMTDAEILNDDDSLTYDFYQKNIKTTFKPEPVVKGWRCRICSYTYEGEELPPDFVCPWCKHGAADFEKITG